ncbi:hypothetical protein [Mesorhizobium sp. M0047]|uniref:hypothetical protein n=1 Tax=unclassified Mesorhizobium TaxID=325217 RepID=UPI0033363B1E
MTATELIRAKEASFGRNVLASIRYYLGGRRGFPALAAAVILAGLASNWSWLAAAGVTPLLLSALPCVAMCALGLCMHKMTGRACPAEDGSPKAEEVAVGPTTVPADLKGNS